MRKITAAILVVIICACPAAALAGGTEAASSELIDRAKDYDGQEVTYTGEVIGDILDRDGFAWINVSDGSNAIGIWVKKSDAQSIGSVGGYTAHGDTVKVTGIFRRACAEHGGDMDIHAQSVEIISQGYPVRHTAETWKTIAGIVLFAGAAVCMIFVLRKRKKKCTAQEPR